jgi:2-aminoadipate transaminase
MSRSGETDEIDELQRAAAADDRVIGLAGGLPGEEQFPRRALAAAFTTVVGRPGAPALQYGWPEGSQPLRGLIARRLRRRGLRITEDDVIITNGAQQAIALVVDLLCRPGDRIGVDPETYPAALELFRSRRLSPVALGQGPPRGLRALYALPAMDNPRGHRATVDERRRLLGARLPIIEDDAYADLCFAGAPPPSLAAQLPARVYHVGTFSKTLCPGLRVGWLVPPRRQLARALRLKHDADLQSNSLAQEVVTEFLAHSDFDGRLARLRRFYRLRAQRLMAAVRRWLPGWRFQAPEGGFALWLEGPPGTRVGELPLLRAAVHRGTSFDPGSLFRPGEAPEPLALRLCFSATAPRLFDEGVRRLARAFDDVARRPGAKRRTHKPPDGR